MAQPCGSWSRPSPSRAANGGSAGPAVRASKERGFAAPGAAEAREHLVTAEGTEELEVLMVPRDEQGRAGHRRTLGEPARAVAGAVVGARGAVQALGIRPDAEVPTCSTWANVSPSAASKASTSA